MPNESPNSRAKHQDYQSARALAPSNLLLTLVLSVFGAIVGIQILVSLGITPNTSLVGALVAMALARIPLQVFKGYRSIHAQNLAQTSISAATFGAANSLFIPIGIPFLLGLPEMIVPMLVGVSLAMFLDGYLLYRMFDTPAFPAADPWPIGVASAEAIKAGDQGGKQVRVLLAGLLTGVSGALAGLPTAAFGIALIGGMAAMTAFGAGLLTRGYSSALFNIDIDAAYIPHGIMIGAGLVAVVQVLRIVIRHYGKKRTLATRTPEESKQSESHKLALGRAMKLGVLGYLGIMLLLTITTGVYTGMSPLMLTGFIVFGTFSAFIHELIAGIAAMHSGWFPAFATALISLLIGIIIGFPIEALVVLAGFSASTGPAFADMGYDLKAGYILRGHRSDAYELDGRRQQWLASMIGFSVAVLIVSLFHGAFFSRGMVPPIDKAYVAAIQAGISPGLARQLGIWAIVGAALQLVGRPRRQLGVLFATGLLITNIAAGWLVMLGLVCRIILKWRWAELGKEVDVFAGGVIAGDALCGFFTGLGKSLMR